MVDSGTRAEKTALRCGVGHFVPLAASALPHAVDLDARGQVASLVDLAQVEKLFSFFLLLSFFSFLNAIKAKKQRKKERKEERKKEKKQVKFSFSFLGCAISAHLLFCAAAVSSLFLKLHSCFGPFDKVAT